jgi:hypothetical protein
MQHLIVYPKRRLQPGLHVPFVKIYQNYVDIAEVRPRERNLTGKIRDCLVIERQDKMKYNGFVRQQRTFNSSWLSRMRILAIKVRYKSRIFCLTA